MEKIVIFSFVFLAFVVIASSNTVNITMPGGASPSMMPSASTSATTVPPAVKTTTSSPTSGTLSLKAWTGLVVSCVLAVLF